MAAATAMSLLAGARCDQAIWGNWLCTIALWQYPNAVDRATRGAMSSDIDLGPVEGLADGRGRCVEAGSVSLAVFRVGAEVFALENACPHRGGPLCEGDVKDAVVYCPLHAWGFDLRSGQCLNVRRSRAQVFPVRVEGGRAFVSVPDGAETVDPDADLA